MACGRFADRSRFAPKRSPRSTGCVIRRTRYPPCSALQFDENCRLSGRLGAFFVHAHGARPNLFERNPAIQGRARKRTGAHDYSTKPLRAQPRHTPAKCSLRSLSLPPILARGFARRAFRLFAPAGFLQGFFELQERSKGEICARPAKCCRENPQSLGSVDKNPRR